MIDTKSREAPLACRPTPENKWLFKAIEKERKRLKLKSKSATIQTILLNHFKNKK